VIRTGYLATLSQLQIGWFLATSDTRDEARAAYEEFTLAYAEANQ
jgi:hypothetical protein